MDDNISSQEHIEEALMSLKFADFIPAVTDPACSRLLDQLGKHIDELINANFNMLLAILYRVDVCEAKVTSELEERGAQESAGRIIAGLILERQREKLKWRNTYTKSSFL